MADETIGRATIQLGADGSKLAPEMAAAVAKAQGALDRANKQMERAQASTFKAIQGHIDKINAARPTNEMRMLEQAVLKLGGTANLTKDQLGRVTSQVNALAAAGAKVPASLSGLTGMGSKLSAAFTSLTTGGGVSGALAAIGPAGVAAAGALGVVTTGLGIAVRGIDELAGRAEKWANLATATGLGAQDVQRLGKMFEDAGVPADALATAMRELQKEISGGGKELARFGISVEDLKGKAPIEQLREMAARVEAINDPTDRAAARSAAFGRSAQELAAVLPDVASGADKMFDALGDAQLAKLKKADEALDGFKRSAKEAKDAFFLSLIPSGGPTDSLGLPLLRSRLNTKGVFPDFKPKVDTSPLTLGDETPEQAAAKAAYYESIRKGEAASKKAADDLLATRKKYNELQASIVKRTSDESALMRDLDEQSKEILATAEKTEKARLSALKETRLRGGDMLPAVGGSGLWTRHQDVLDQEMENAAASAAVAKEKTEDWATSLDSLAQQLQVLASTTGGLTGKIVSFAASLASGLGGALAGFKSLTGGGSILQKISGGLGMVGSIVGVAGSLVSGIKSLFGGKSKEQKAAEAAAKEQKAAEAKQAAQEAADRRQEAAVQARTFAESLSDKIAAGGMSEKLTGALQNFVGKVGDALGKLGMGVVDARLKDSKEFQAASGVAGDVAGALGAASQAGIMDAGLTAAASGAAEAIQQDAITAARAAGLSDMEAAKQGSLAIAQILREQLHASIRSGNELDDNTRRLLEEAKKNGIEIIADPMVESLGVQREILATLRGQGGRTGGGDYGMADEYGPGPSNESRAPEPTWQELAAYEAGKGVRKREDVPAAGGFGPMITPNLGHGLGPRIQTHPGELAMVIPKSRVGAAGVLSAAGGLYSDKGGTSRSTVVNYSLNVAPTLTPLSSVESQREAIGLVTTALGEIMRANNNRLIREIADAVRPHV